MTEFLWSAEYIVIGLQLLILTLSLIFFVLGKAAPGNSFISGSLTPAHISFILKGYVQYGDLVALIPYWTRNCVIHTVFTETGAPICTRKFDAANTLPEDERALMDAMFNTSSPLSPYYVDTAMKARLLAVKSIIDEDFRTERYQAFTKASMRARTLISVFGFFSIVIPCFDLMLIFLNEPVEIFGGVLAAVGMALLAVNPMRKLTNLVSKNKRLGAGAVLLPLTGMILLFFVGIGIALFVDIYIQEKALSAWLMAGNYIVLPILYLLALKLTDSARMIVDSADLDDPLIKEVTLMNLGEAESHRMLQVMLVVQKAWNEAEKVRVKEHPSPNY